MKSIRIFIFAILLSGLWLNVWSQLPISMKKALYASHHNMGLTMPGSVILSACEHLDTCILKVTYDVSFVNDTLRKNKFESDIQILEIGKHLSHCFSYLLYQNDSLITALHKKGITNFPSLHKYVIPEEVYTHADKKQMEVLNRSPHLLPCCQYTEDVPAIEWKLLNDQKDVLGYRCQKAICNFRGREYVAWYTEGLPLRYGPYKFGGLPGLILEIFDTRNNYKWKCIGIKKENDKSYISRYKYSRTNMTRETAREMISYYHKDPAGALSLTGRLKGYVGTDNIEYKPVSGDFPPEPYNPIEKE